jgi:hypothetical protein
LASDLEEEYEKYGLHPMFGGLYPDENDQLEEEEPTDDITNYEAVDDDFSGEVANFNGEEGDYVDFLGIEDILNSPNNDVDEFYVDEENYMFIKEITADPFLSIFMACGREKEQEKYSKSEVLPCGVWDFHDNHQGIPMMRSVTLILRCSLVLILRKGEWNELTRHSKDTGKNQLNLRLNSLQRGENDVDEILFEGRFGTTLYPAIERIWALDRTRDGARAHKGGLCYFHFYWFKPTLFHCFIRLRVFWGYLCHILLGLGFWSL